MNHQTYNEFRQNPFIQSIQDNPKWTISDSNKMPLDMHILFDETKIKGAHFHDERSLVTLPEIDDYFSKLNQIATNHAYFLDVMTDHFMVLDVEPSCPDELKQKLLQTDYIYGEVSLSGKGYHLVFKEPKCFLQYPNAYAKKSLKHANKYYEILLNQFCTFTGNMIPLQDNPTTDFNDIYKELATEARDISVKRDVNVQSIEEKPDTEYADKILDMLRMSAHDYKKKPEDFKKDKSPGENDMSRYEWAYIAYLNWKLSSILAVQFIAAEHEYTDDEKAYFLYTVIKEMLPHREKHDTYRYTKNNQKLPWLGYLVQDVMAKTDNDEPKNH